jgi:hypothetical protein
MTRIRTRRKHSAAPPLAILEDGNALAPLQKRTIWRVISLSIAVCCRRISAVQKLRTAPAQALAALSQRLIQGLDMKTPSPHEDMMSAALRVEAGIVAAFQ